MNPKSKNESKSASKLSQNPKSLSRVLIVEDVPEMQLLLKEVFEGVPDFVVSGLAANGFEARLEASRRRPDIVLLDEVLPGESCIDLLDFFVELGISVWMITGEQTQKVTEGGAGAVKKSRPVPDGALGRLFKPSWKSLDQDRIGLLEQISSQIKPR